MFVYVDGKDADLDPVLSMGELAAGLSVDVVSHS